MIPNMCCEKKLVDAFRQEAKKKNDYMQLW